MKVVHRYNLNELEQIIRDYYQGIGYNDLTILIESGEVAIEFEDDMYQILEQYCKS